MALFSYNNFCETQHLVAQHITRLDNVDDLALHLLSGSEFSHRLAEVGVELPALDVDLGDPFLAERIGKFL